MVSRKSLRLEHHKIDCDDVFFNDRNQYADRLYLPTKHLIGGWYRIGWGYRWHQESNNLSDFFARISIGSHILHEHSDSIDFDPVQRGFCTSDLEPGIKHIHLQFASSKKRLKAIIEDCYLYIFRV